MFTALAALMAVRSRGLASGSPPPWRAAMVISLMYLENTLPRAWSVAAFLRRIVAHLEWPDMILGDARRAPPPRARRERSRSPDRRARAALLRSWSRAGSACLAPE